MDTRLPVYADTNPPTNCHHVLVTSETPTHYQYACRLCGQAVKLPRSTAQRMHNEHELATLIKTVFSPPDDDDDPPPPIAAHIVTIPGDDAEATFIKLLRDLGAHFVDVTPGPDTPDGDEEA